MMALDASALLALLFREPGHQRVAQVLGDCCMTTLNLSEVLGRFARDGHSPGDVWARLRATPIEWVPFTDALALTAAQLLPKTRGQGLSLGDRACLALALTRGIPVVTTDRLWAELGLGIQVELIR
jgi:PIN domain nuclease of toxin-antitoxin system